jgi:hypothetical protein
MHFDAAAGTVSGTTGFDYTSLTRSPEAQMGQMFCGGGNHVAKTFQQKRTMFFDFASRVRFFAGFYQSGNTLTREH